jgi:hypothetical protein
MTKKERWDGRSRIPTKKYKENYDSIFGKKGSVLNVEERFVSKEYNKKIEPEEVSPELQKILDRNGF